MTHAVAPRYGIAHGMANDIETLPAGVSRSEGARRALFTTVRREMHALKKKAKGGKS